MAERSSLNASERYSILARDAFTCQYCGRSAPEVELHVDHLIPVAKGGTDDPFNLLAACAECNLAKSDLPLPQSILREKQQGILKRMKVFKETKRQHVRSKSNKPLPEHLYQRPTSLLRTHRSTVEEPLAGRVLNPSKRHVLSCEVDEDLRMRMSYVRERKRGWDSYPILLPPEKSSTEPSWWEPMFRDSFVELYDNAEIEVLDELKEKGIHIKVLQDTKGVCFLLASNDEYTLVYGFWVPLKNIEFALTILSEDHAGTFEFF